MTRGNSSRVPPMWMATTGAATTTRTQPHQCQTDGVTTQSLAYNSANQISSPGYAYDGAGNLTATPDGSTFSHNAAEQMSQATVAGTTSAYVCAGTGERELTSAGGNHSYACETDPQIASTGATICGVHWAQSIFRGSGQ